MEITRETRLSDLINQYSWLMGKATIAEMSKKSGMDADTLIRRLQQLIGSHT